MVRVIETEPCRNCKGEGHVPVYRPRDDGYYEQVFAKCGSCDGLGTVKNDYSTTPFLYYFTRLETNSK